MQLPIPLKNWRADCYYECVNPQCFYNETELGYDDVVFRDMWVSDVQNVELVPHCPSCMEEMIFWRHDDGEI